MVISKQFISRITLLRERVDSFGQYPFSLDAVKALDFFEPHPRVTFIVGENGSGKSTLLEAIAIAMGFNPEGGSKNFQFDTRPSHSNLSEYLRISKGLGRPKGGFFLRAESFFNVATTIERLDAEPSSGPRIIDSYGGISLHEQSHGESFMALLTKRFWGGGLYLLDEPEAALSAQRQLEAVGRIHSLASDGSQFIIATHSPILLAYPYSTILQIGRGGISCVPYRETEIYKAYCEFIRNPELSISSVIK